MRRRIKLFRRREMIQLADVRKALGTNAGIIFASWIVMGFLQQRYDAAVSRHREAVAAHERDRAGNLKDQVLLYRRRCQLMTLAIVFGLSAAILLIASLILAAIDVMVPKLALIDVVGIVCAVGGLVFVIVAAFIVIAEGRIVSRQINDELRNVPDLAERAGKPSRS